MNDHEIYFDGYTDYNSLRIEITIEENTANLDKGDPVVQLRKNCQQSDFDLNIHNMLLNNLAKVRDPFRIEYFDLKTYETHSAMLIFKKRILPMIQRKVISGVELSNYFYINDSTNLQLQKKYLKDNIENLYRATGYIDTLYLHINVTKKFMEEVGFEHEDFYELTHGLDKILGEQKHCRVDGFVNVYNKKSLILSQIHKVDELEFDIVYEKNPHLARFRETYPWAPR
jgi:hypothetical protein